MRRSIRELGFVVLHPLLLAISAIGLQRTTSAALAGEIGSLVQWVIWAILFSVSLFGFSKSLTGYVERAMLARIKRRNIPSTAAEGHVVSHDPPDAPAVLPKAAVGLDDLAWIGLVLVVGGMDGLSLYALQASVREIFSGQAGVGWSLWQVVILGAASYGLTMFSRSAVEATLDRTKRKRKKLVTKILKLLKDGSRHAAAGATTSTFTTAVVVVAAATASAATTWTPAWHAPRRAASRPAAAASPPPSPSPTPSAPPSPTPSPTRTPSGTPAATAPARVDHVPIAANDASTTRSGRPVTVNALANDKGLHDKPIAITKRSGPAHGTAVLNANKTWTYTSVASYVGTDSFVYRACDAQDQCDTATVSITVLQNHTPAAVNDAGATAPDIPVSENVLTNDTGLEDAPVKVSVTTAPAHGTVSINNSGAYTYTPAPAYAGSDSFVYRVCDSDNQCDTATVSISMG